MICNSQKDIIKFTFQEITKGTKKHTSSHCGTTGLAVSLQHQDAGSIPG